MLFARGRSGHRELEKPCGKGCCGGQRGAPSAPASRRQRSTRSTRSGSRRGGGGAARARAERAPRLAAALSAQPRGGALLSAGVLLVALSLHTQLAAARRRVGTHVRTVTLCLPEVQLSQLWGQAFPFSLVCVTVLRPSELRGEPRVLTGVLVACVMTCEPVTRDTAHV